MGSACKTWDRKIWAYDNNSALFCVGVKVNLLSEGNPEQTFKDNIKMDRGARIGYQVVLNIQ